MNPFMRCLSLSVTLVALMISATGSAQNGAHLQTDLSGFKEVVGPELGIGAIFSTGNGQLTLQIDKQKRQITYQLTYRFPDAIATPIVGTQFVNQAHLHFGQKHTTGAINVWLCQSADNPAPAAVAAGTPMCPSPSGTVAGSITPAKVLALPSSGFPGGEAGFDALLAAIGSDAIYGNVHTDRSPAGEIRGQVGDLPPSNRRPSSFLAHLVIDPMSAFGTKRTFQPKPRMSAFGGKAAITVGSISSETHPDALLAFPIIAAVGVLTAKVRRQE